MKLFLTYILTFCSILSFGQNATIKGKINTSDGKPAEFVNVQLNGTNKGTIANENGEYKIERIKAGTYKLKVSLVGLETKEQEIEVKAGANIGCKFYFSRKCESVTRSCCAVKF